MEKIYNVFARMGEPIAEIEADLVAEYGSDSIPERSVEIADPLPLMLGYTSFYLTEEEAKQVATDPRVHSVEEPSKLKVIKFGEGSQKGEMIRFSPSVEDGSYSDYITYDKYLEYLYDENKPNTFAKAPLTNWALGRHKKFTDKHLRQTQAPWRPLEASWDDDFDELSSDVQSGQATATPRVDRRNVYSLGTYGEDFSWEHDGEGVDIIIIDTGVDANNPEWEDADGNSRFVRFDWNAEGMLSGNANIPTNFYRDYDGHGTHVASSAAGKQHGFAKGARIFALPAIDHPHQTGLGGALTACFYFVNQKRQAYAAYHDGTLTADTPNKSYLEEQIVADNGVSRPTVINMSLGISFYVKEITELTHKGTTHYVGQYDEDGDYVRDGDFNSTDLQRVFGLHMPDGALQIGSEDTAIQNILHLLMYGLTSSDDWADFAPHLAISSGNHSQRLDINKNYKNDVNPSGTVHDRMHDHEMLSDHFGEDFAGQDWDNTIQAKYYFDDENDAPQTFYPHRPTSPWHPDAHLVGAIAAPKDNGLYWDGYKRYDSSTFYTKDNLIEINGTRGKFESKAGFSCHGAAVNTWAAGEQILAAQSFQKHINENLTTNRFSDGFGEPDEHILNYGDFTESRLEDIAPHILCPANSNSSGMKIEFDKDSVNGQLRMYFRLTPEAIAAFTQEYEPSGGNRYPSFEYSGGVTAEYTGIRNIKTFVQWDTSHPDLEALDSHFPSYYFSTNASQANRYTLNTEPYAIVSYDCPAWQNDDGQDTPARFGRTMYGVGTNTTSDIGAPTATNYRVEMGKGIAMMNVDYNLGRNLGLNSADYSLVSPTVPEITDSGLEDRVFFELSIPYTDLPPRYNPNNLDYDPTADFGDLFRCTATLLNFYTQDDELIQSKLPVTQSTSNIQLNATNTAWNYGYGAPWIRDFTLDDDTSILTHYAGGTHVPSIKDANSFSMVFGASQLVQNGTSMATPHVAGMMACQLEKQPMRPRELLLHNTSGSDSSSTRSGIAESGEVGFPKDHLTSLYDFADGAYHEDGDHHWAKWYGSRLSDLTARPFPTTGLPAEYYAIIGARNVVTTTDCKRDNETKITGEIILHSDEYRDNSVFTYEHQTTPAVYGYLNEDEVIDLNLIVNGKDYTNTNGMWEKFGKIPSRYVPQNIMDTNASWVPKSITGEAGVSAITTQDNQTFTATWKNENPSPTAVTTATFDGKLFNTSLNQVSVNLLPQNPILLNADANNEITGFTYEKHYAVNGVNISYADHNIIGWDYSSWSHLRQVAQLVPNMPLSALTINILEEDDYDSFELDNDMIQFKDTMNGHIDYETKNYYQIKVQLLDNYGRISPVYTIKIDILDRTEIIPDLELIPRNALSYNNANAQSLPFTGLTHAVVDEHEQRTHIYTLRGRDPRGQALDYFKFRGDGAYSDNDDYAGTPFELVTSTYTDANGDDWEQLDLYITNIDYEYGLNYTEEYESDNGSVFEILGSYVFNGVTYNRIKLQYEAQTTNSARTNGYIYIYVANRNVEPHINDMDSIHIDYSNGAENYGGVSAFNGGNGWDGQLYGVRPNCMRVNEGIKAGDVIATVSLASNDTDMFGLLFAPHPTNTGGKTLTNAHVTDSFNGIDYLAGDDFTNNVGKHFKHNDSNGNPYFGINDNGEIIALQDINYDANDHTFNFYFMYATTYAPDGWETDWTYKNYGEILVEVVDVDMTPHFVDGNGNNISTMNLNIVEHQDVGTVLASFETAFPASITYHLINSYNGQTYTPDPSYTTDPSGEFYLLLDDEGQPISGEVTSGNLAVASKHFPNYEGQDVNLGLGTVSQHPYFIRLTATNSDGTANLTVLPTFLDDPNVDNIQLTLSAAQPMTVQEGDSGTIFTVSCNVPESERTPFTLGATSTYGTDTTINGLTIYPNGLVSLVGSATYANIPRMLGSVRCQHLETGEWAVAQVDVNVNAPSLFTNTVRTIYANVYGNNYTGYYYGYMGFANGSMNRLDVSTLYPNVSGTSVMTKFAYHSNTNTTQLEIGTLGAMAFSHTNFHSNNNYGSPTWNTINVGSNVLNRATASTWYNAYLDYVRYSWTGNFMPTYNVTTTMTWN